MSRDELQKRIGLLFSAVALGSLAVNLLLLSMEHEFPLGFALTAPTTLMILAFGGVYLLTAYLSGVVGRVLQLAALCVFSISQIFEYYLSVFGVGFVILAMLLAYRYGMLERARRYKILAAMIITIGIVGMSASMHGVSFPIGVGIVVFNSGLYLVVFGLACWFAFEEEIRSLSRRLNAEIQLNKRAVKISENTGGLVHNLRNDLNVIDAGIELARMDPERFTIDDIKSRVDRLAGRVERIMYAVKLSKMSEVQPVELNKLISAVLESFQVERNFRTTARVELCLGEDTVVHASPADLAQILENLVENAYHAVSMHKEVLDARQELGRIRVESCSTAEHVSITVHDNGCGMTTTDPQQFRVGRTTKAHGSGYGMVFVRDTLAEYGGRIEIETVPAGGTSVTLWLPRNTGGEVTRQPDGHQESGSPS